MSTHTHTPTEWAAAGSLGVSAISLIALAVAFADADAAYFDPRPAARRAVAAARRVAAPTHEALVYAGYDLNRAAASAHHALYPASVPVRCAVYSARELGRDVAALVLLLTTSPKGALR